MSPRRSSLRQVFSKLYVGSANVRLGVPTITARDQGSVRARYRSVRRLYYVCAISSKSCGGSIPYSSESAVTRPPPQRVQNSSLESVGPAPHLCPDFISRMIIRRFDKCVEILQKITELSDPLSYA